MKNSNELDGRPRTLLVSADEARTIIPGLISAGEFYEASWVTGRHFADADYEVGEYVTCERAGHYTTHPRYAGVRSDSRPDDEGYSVPVVEWVLGELPKTGQVEILVKANRAISSDNREAAGLRREIREKLATQAALTWLYHSHGDDRGLALANTLEDEAHALWRGMGNEDIPTYLLTQKCGEAAQ